MLILLLSNSHIVFAAYLIFLASYVVFAIGRFPGTHIDRPAAAVVGAAMMFAFRVLNAEQGLRSIDYQTIVLLFAMMVVVAGLHLAGFFDSVAGIFVQLVRPAALLPVVIFTSGILSAFLLNDIVCLLMAPLVMQVSRQMSRRATPYLLALATASNIGSTATITGNPQNILIGSVSHIPYLDFAAHLGPVALIGLMLDWAILHLIYFRRPLTVEIPAAVEVIAVKSDGRRSHLLFPIAITFGVLAGFLLGYPPALVASVGAAILLLHPRYPSTKVYGEVNWSLLVFFAGLFLIVGGAEQVGIAQRLLSIAEHLNLQN
ncbi:MAG: anion transporter, partial [Acidobacteria bacterium]|nr:anion transporter [Acidobacteriota bacterium]